MPPGVHTPTFREITPTSRERKDRIAERARQRDRENWRGEISNYPPVNRAGFDVRDINFITETRAPKRSKEILVRDPVVRPAKTEIGR